MDLTFEFLETSGLLGPESVSPMKTIDPPLALRCLRRGEIAGTTVFQEGETVYADKCYDHTAAGDFKHTVHLQGMQRWWKFEWFVVKQ